MEVVTLGPKQFSEACEHLASRIASLCPEGFDLVIAIPRAGRYVAKELMPHLPQCEYAEITCQRPSTKKKKGTVSAILKTLPTILTDMLRVIEAWCLPHLPVKPPAVHIPDGTLPKGCKRILIVDDSVDSGRTLLAVKNAVAAARPHATITTAVITVTTKKPLITPDVRLYDTPVLVRSYWSADYNPSRYGGN